MSFAYDNHIKDERGDLSVGEKLTRVVQTIFEKFRWTGSEDFSKPENVRKQMGRFLKSNGKELGLNENQIMDWMQKDLDLAMQWYKESFPNGEMSYHNFDHVRNTWAVAMKMFLGRLAYLKSNNPDMTIFKDQANLEKAIRTSSAVFAMHEYDDWWKRNVDMGDEANLNNMQLREGKLRESLEQQGISWDDFVALSTLDDFTQPLENRVYALRKKSGKKVFADLAENDELNRRELLFAIGGSISAADFAQICNPSYSEEVEFEVGGKAYKTFRGLVTLAEEMRRFRPNALRGLGWAVVGSDPPEINWENVKWSRFFFYEVALPRIMHGSIDLRNFDEGEYERMWGRILKLEDKLAYTDPLPTPREK